ncbi:hypothetical protein SDC9_183145 [bioreactor metagenome]|uniref:Uncharacterized protein n=1 Tax=bioreactor metagenome TaxID=1076179 RepID=A0A645H9H1_9ZZZZ
MVLPKFQAVQNAIPRVPGFHAVYGENPERGTETHDQAGAVRRSQPVVAEPGRVARIDVDQIGTDQLAHYHCFLHHDQMFLHSISVYNSV